MANRQLVTIILGLLNFIMLGAIARAEPVRIAMPFKIMTLALEALNNETVAHPIDQAARVRN